MNFLVAATSAQAPTVEYGTLAPILVLGGGAVLVLMVALFSGRFVQRLLVPLLATAVLIVAGVLFAAGLGNPDPSVLTGALRFDDLAYTFDLIFVVSALATVVMAWRSQTAREVGSGEFFGLLLAAVTGMAMLASATNLVAFFVAFELFSIPLYVLCAADLRRTKSLESGLKYLIIGSLGSATMLYGLALIYGATGTTDFNGIGAVIGKGAVASDSLLLVGVGLVLAGLAFKASIAPFHQWTPDVYEGAPTPVTAFMAVATKAAAFAILLRFTGAALHDARDHWQPVLAALAVTTVFVGNFGALRQTSVKRIMAYSGVAQAGYLLVGVVAGTTLGAEAVVFYFLVYLLMNAGAFAVIAARERAGRDDSLASFSQLGAENPALAWSMTVFMIALAGLPITGGFVGKFYLVQASIDAHYAWLGVAIVLGSVVSLGYYLRIIATMWMDRTAGDHSPATELPVIAGASPEADASNHRELVVLAVLMAVLVVLAGFVPSPLFDLARDAGNAFAALL